MKATIRNLLCGAVATLALAGPCFATPLYHLTDLGVLPGDAVSAGMALNASGQVTGYGYYLKTQTNPFYSAFIYSGGVMQDMNNLPGVAASGQTLNGAHDINDTGQIVGTAVSVRWNTGLQGLVRWGRGVEMTPRRFQEPRDARTTNERAGQRSGEGTILAADHDPLAAKPAGDLRLLLHRGTFASIVLCLAA